MMDKIKIEPILSATKWAISKIGVHDNRILAFDDEHSYLIEAERLKIRGDDTIFVEISIAKENLCSTKKKSLDSLDNLDDYDFTPTALITFQDGICKVKNFINGNNKIYEEIAKECLKEIKWQS